MKKVRVLDFALYTVYFIMGFKRNPQRFLLDLPPYKEITLLGSGVTILPTPGLNKGRME